MSEVTAKMYSYVLAWSLVKDVERKQGRMKGTGVICAKLIHVSENNRYLV